MSDLPNPYASSGEPIQGGYTGQDSMQIVPAGQGARFLNMIIDIIVYYVIIFALGFAVALIGGDTLIDMLDDVPGFMIGFPIMFGYYFLFEMTTGRTIGKMVTGTMVVDEEGNPASAAQIAARTICRFIPFEAFSFLFTGRQPRGWHDSIPKTYVVKSR